VLLLDLNALDKEKERLEKEIKETCFYQEDIYDENVIINGKKYFYFNKNLNRSNYYGGNENVEFYIPFEKIKTNKEFKPLDKNLDEIEWARCNFKGTKTCTILVNWRCKRDNCCCNRNDSYWNNDYYTTTHQFTPKLLHKKDDKKPVHPRLIKAFIEDLNVLTEKLQNAIITAKSKQKEFLEKADNPFLSKEKIALATETINKQVEEIELRIKEAQKLATILNEAITDENAK
jgi:MoxR-like ATPase